MIEKGPKRFFSYPRLIQHHLFLSFNFLLFLMGADCLLNPILLSLFKLWSQFLLGVFCPLIDFEKTLLLGFDILPILYFSNRNHFKDQQI